MFNWLFRKKEKRKREKLMFANNLHVKLVLQCFATLATQILEILVLV